MSPSPYDTPDPAWAEVENCPVCGTHPNVRQAKDTGRFSIDCCSGLVSPATGRTPRAVVTAWRGHVAEAEGRIAKANPAHFGRVVFALLRQHQERYGDEDGLNLPDMGPREACDALRVAVEELAEDMGLCKRCLGVGQRGVCGNCDEDAERRRQGQDWDEMALDADRERRAG